MLPYVNTFKHWWEPCERLVWLASEHLVWLAFVTQIRIQHYIKNSMTSRHLDSKSRKVPLTPWRGFLSFPLEDKGGIVR